MTPLETLYEPVATTVPAITPTRTLWRVGGGLALAHVVLLFAGFAFEVFTDPAYSPAKVTAVYAAAPESRVLTGGYVEACSFIVLALALVVLTCLLGRMTPLGRLAALSALVLGCAYVASTLAVGFPPGAAALHAAHLGAPPATVAAVNDVRTYGYILQTALQASFVLALGVAAASDRVLPRWGRVGVAVGALGIIATPLAQNAVGMVLIVWWVGLAVLALRVPRSALLG